MSGSDQPMYMQEQILLLQQQQQQSALLQLLQDQQQQPFPENSTQPPAPRQKFKWSPPSQLVECMDFDEDLFTGQPLSDRQRTAIIDQYAPIAGVDYRPPDALPRAYNGMSDYQRSQDQSLKSTQYLMSAVFRSLDLLAHSLNQPNPDRTACMKILYDARALLLNASHTVNQYRNNIAIKSANKSFKPDLPLRRNLWLGVA